MSMITRSLAESLFNFWIVAKNGGICIFAQEFAELPVKINEDLAAGFFTAIHMFSKEATGQSIKFMELEETCFHFHDMEHVYFVLVTTKDADRGEIQTFFSRVQQRFEARFAEQLEKGQFNDMSVFSGFAADIEEEIGKKSMFQSLFELPSDIIKARYDEARKQMISMRKALIDTGFDAVKSIANFGVIKHVLKKQKARRDDRDDLHLK